jgi:hypothetical protein
VRTAGINYADTHQALSREVAPRRAVTGEVLTIGQCRVGR